MVTLDFLWLSPSLFIYNFLTNSSATATITKQQQVKNKFSIIFEYNNNNNSLKFKQTKFGSKFNNELKSKMNKPKLIHFKLFFISPSSPV